MRARWRQRRKIKRGFTLIEIILALLVISIGIVSLIGLLSTSLDSASKAHSDLNSVSFADMVFNYCHSVTNWAEIPTSGDLNIPDYTGNTTPIHIDQLSRFDCIVPDFGNNPKRSYTVSYIFHIERFDQVKALSLEVWPGYSSNGTPRTFYTELYNWMKN